MTNERLIGRATMHITALSRATEHGTDVMVALGRAFDKLIRQGEDSLTVEERLRYYQLRDEGVAAIDALSQVREGR